MQKFPIARDEAKRLLKIEELQLGKITKPCAELEDLVEELVCRYKTKHVTACSVSVIDDKHQIMLAQRYVHFKDGGLVGRITDPNFTFNGARKVSVCQYVVATDEVLCFRMGKDDNVKKYMPMADQWFMEQAPKFSEADPVMREMFELMNSFYYFETFS